MSESTRSHKPAADLHAVHAARTTSDRLRAALNVYLAAEARHEQERAKREAQAVSPEAPHRTD